MWMQEEMSQDNGDVGHSVNIRLPFRVRITLVSEAYKQTPCEIREPAFSNS